MVWQSELLGTVIDHRIRLQPAATIPILTMIVYVSLLTLYFYLSVRAFLPHSSRPVHHSPSPPNKDERRRREDDELNWLPVVSFRNRAGGVIPASRLALVLLSHSGPSVLPVRRGGRCGWIR